MKGFFPVYSKEMYRTFASPVFYVVAFTFLTLAGYFFYLAVAYYSLLSFQAGRNPFMAQQLNLSEMVLEPFFGSIGIVLLLMVPLITMRLLAEEKKTGTAELLLTYPISDRGAVLGKYTAALSVMALMLTGTLPAMVVLSAFTTPPWATIFSGYLGLLLMLAERVEENKFADVVPLLNQLKVKEDVLMAAQLEAIQWTNNLAEIA